jgi:hypothetical protein
VFGANPASEVWSEGNGVLQDQKNYKLILKKEEIEAPRALVTLASTIKHHQAPLSPSQNTIEN